MYAAALIVGDLPLNERLQILSKHVDPAPGAEIRVDETSSREFTSKTSQNGLAYGFITINPPAGTCFNVTIATGRNDIEVCRKTQMRWRLEDLDRQKSTLTWVVKTNPKDFGTPITWKAPYQVAKVIPLGKELGTANSIPLFIENCEAMPADAKNGYQRRVRLTLFDKKQFIIRFPEKDEMLPQKSERRPYREPDPEEEKKKAREANKDEPPPPPPEAPMDTDNWTIASRRGFEMSVSNFVTDGSMPEGKLGRCRYQYEGVAGDAESGRIECHYSDRFTYFYAPVPCIKYLKP